MVQETEVPERVQVSTEWRESYRSAAQQVAESNTAIHQESERLVDLVSVQTRLKEQMEEVKSEIDACNTRLTLFVNRRRDSKLSMDEVVGSMMTAYNIPDVEGYMYEPINGVIFRHTVES